ncbi:MAG: hypothetical protein QOF89_4939 [Acidobacteriota bacterium]|nr:hypothetical protein [Acidobacteriota bacterium]
MLDGLLLAWVLLAWGAQAVVPWRLPGEEPGRRRPWAVALLLLLVTGAVAVLAYALRHPDAAVVHGLYPLAASRTGRLLAVLLSALALVDLVAAAAGSRFEPAAWRLAAGFGLIFLLVASWMGELLRIGEGPESGLIPLAILTGLRLLLALAAAETLTTRRRPGRPVFAPFAGAGLALYYLLLPAPLAQALWRQPAIFTLVATAILFLAARWLPPSLRRWTLGAATLLAGIFLAQAALLSQGLGVLQ